MRPGSFCELDRQADVLPAARVLDHHLAVADLRIVEPLAQRLDRRERDVLVGHPGDPLGLGPGPEGLARGTRAPAAWPGPGGSSHSSIRSGRPSAREQVARELDLGAAERDEPAVAGLVHAGTWRCRPRSARPWPPAGASRRAAARSCWASRRSARPSWRRRRSRPGRSARAATAPSARPRARCWQASMSAAASRRVPRPVVPAEIDREHARHRLDRQVVRRPVRVGPALPVGRDRGVDDARVARGDRPVADAEPIDHARAKRLDEHVRRSRQGGAAPRRPPAVLRFRVRLLLPRWVLAKYTETPSRLSPISPVRLAARIGSTLITWAP